ncbi:MAG: hypothetical protein DDT40_01646 [candidate division WS2 bacterium]|nr:hypothetical protein [Candidatus Psychracetigena formicireducens]
MTKKELIKIYNEMTDSEKYGVQFALFPVRLWGLTKEETILLMDVRKEIEKQDINK